MKPKTVGRAIGYDPTSHPYIPPDAQAGFASGTIILTQDGEMPVEFLSPGDRVISRDAGLVKLTGTSRSQQVVQAISFAAGSLGHTRPDQDLILPADQKILIRDWRANAMFRQPQTLVSACDIVDGEFICDLGLVPMVLHQLRFDHPHVIYAGGLEVACGPSKTRTALRTAA